MTKELYVPREKCLQIIEEYELEHSKPKKEIKTLKTKILDQEYDLDCDKGTIKSLENKINILNWLKNVDQILIV